MEDIAVLDLAFIILAFGSAYCWFASALVKFRNNAGTTVNDLSGTPQFKVADPEELMEFLSKQSKWNSWVAFLAGLAAIAGAFIALNP